jgi:hypothetical protein
MSTTEKMSANFERYCARLEEIRADREPRGAEARRRDLLAAYEEARTTHARLAEEYRRGVEERLERTRSAAVCASLVHPLLKECPDELRRWDAFLAAAKEHEALKTLGVAGVVGVPEPERPRELGAHGPRDRGVRAFVNSFRRGYAGGAAAVIERRPEKLEEHAGRGRGASGQTKGAA